MSPRARRTCFFVSDHTGVSAEVLGRALLAQFAGVSLERVTLPFVATAEQLQAVLNQIARAAREDGLRPVVFSTLIDPALRKALLGADALVIDFFEPFIGRLERELGRSPSRQIGGAHGVSPGPNYQQRIDAVNFALGTDDGLQAQHYGAAEVVLVGVSRCGKTPTCLYLALHYGISAANFPLTQEELDRHDLPQVLLPFVNRLFGLTIDPLRLHQIRSERRPDSGYASLGRCRTEVSQAEALFRSHRVPFLDTTSASIEEIASSVVARSGLKRHTL